MKVRDESYELGGHRLTRYLFTPDSDDQIRAAAIHYHGQGDFSERYDETMEIFTAQGIACVTTDLPGHGRSEGKRGRIPGFEMIDQIAQSNQDLCRKLCPVDRGPLGVLGHSAGGLMALRDLLLRPNRYAFSWISSPLIRPEANQSALLVWLAPLVARLLPGLTVSTGVTTGDCVHQEGPEPAMENRSEYFHARVSLGWGYEMIQAARRVRSLLNTAPPNLPLLITQGGADPVCPPEHLRAALTETTLPNLSYHEFPEALHEPFADSGKEQVFATIEGWLDGVMEEFRRGPAGSRA